MSIGADRVRMSFNPSHEKLVDQIKFAAAELIDLVEKHKDLDPRLAALAQTVFEEGAMWGVKLATTEDQRKRTAA